MLVYDGTLRGGTGTMYETGGTWEPVETDGEGAFAVPYCVDRPYRLRFIEPKTMLVHDAGPLEPGATEHEIMLPDDAFVDVLEGEVLDVHGEPVRGAQISLAAMANDPSHPTRSGRSGRSVLTDEEGRFRIDRAPWRHLTIDVDPRPDAMSRRAEVAIGDRRPDGPLTLQVDLDCRVHVTIERDDVVRFDVLDGDGERMRLATLESGMTTWRRDVRRVANGEFPVFEVSQRATEFVLFGASGEVDRVPVRLSPTGRNDIEL